MEEDLVEGIGRSGERRIGGGNLQEGAAFEGEVALHELVDEGVEVGSSGGGQEAKVAEIDTHDGRQGSRMAAGADELDGAEQSAVASDREEVVGADDIVAVGHMDGFQTVGEERLLKGVEGGAVGVVDVAVVEGYFHVGFFFRS